MALSRKVMRLSCRMIFSQRQDKWNVNSWCRLSFNIMRHKSSDSEIMQENLFEEDAIGSFRRAIGHSRVDQLDQLKIEPDQPKNARILKLAIIGSPNAGKSTLANQLTGWKVSAVSEKIHTTRQNIKSVFTDGDVQIVVKDTPGIVRRRLQKKKVCEKSLLEAPDHGLKDADLICVIVDAGDNMDVLGLDPGIRNLLQKYIHLPSFLVLNKVDLVRIKPDLLRYVWTLTNGVVGGKPLPNVKTREKWNKKKIFKEKMFAAMDAKLQKDPQYRHKFLNDSSNNSDNLARSDNNVTGSKEFQNGENTESEISDNMNRKSSTSVPDRSKLTLYTKAQLLQDNMKQRGIPGWPHFEEVFMLSALYDRGISVVAEYLNEKAKTGDWCYHSSVVTVHNPEELARQCVWSAILQYTSQEVPYKVYPFIENWVSQPDGTIRISMGLETKNVRQYTEILGPLGETHRKIREFAVQNLMDLFRTDVNLNLQVTLHGSAGDRDTKKENYKNKRS